MLNKVQLCILTNKEKTISLIHITKASHPRTPQRFVKYTNFQTHKNTFDQSNSKPKFTSKLITCYHNTKYNGRFVNKIYTKNSLIRTLSPYLILWLAGVKFSKWSLEISLIVHYQWYISIEKAIKMA